MMRKLRRYLFPLLVIALLIGLGWWLSEDNGQPQPALAQGEEAETDYYLRGFVLHSADDSGRWRYRVEGERLLHYVKDGVSTIAAPRMVFYTAEGAPWYGTAERGRLWAGGDQGELLGAVELRRPASAHNRAVTLTTRDVRLRPNDQYAETDAPVRIDHEAGWLTGVGGRVYLDQDRYQLLSKVKGRYEPTRH